MLDYADYNFYTQEYKGNLAMPLFNSLIVKASREIDNHVNRKITRDDLKSDYGYKIKHVACELCEIINNESSNSGVTSISIDGVSKTMKSTTEIRKIKNKSLSNLPEELTRYL